LLVSYASVGWGTVSGALSIGYGLRAHSVALVGAGAAVLADLLSSVVLAVRFRSGHEHPVMERRAQRVSASCLVAIGLGLIVAASLRLAAGVGSQPSAGPVVVAAMSVVVLPVLALLKYRIAPLARSHALRLDAHISVVGAATSAFTLLGLALTSAFSWSSADSYASLVIAVLAGVTGIRELRT
jgi:divalent metal cation (Fe/Co/Zn/Cd) transporter